jgi:hypothetical protein
MEECVCVCVCVCVCEDFCKVENPLTPPIYHFFPEEDNTCVPKYFPHPRVENRIQTLCRLRMTCRFPKMSQNR